MKQLRKTAIALAVVAVTFLAATARAQDKPSASKEFTLVSVEIDQTKFWLPSTIEVMKGDHVKLHLKNMVPGKSPHGFELKSFNISEVIEPGQEKTVEFDASTPGIYSYICQLHAAHVGGQLVVHSSHK